MKVELTVGLTSKKDKLDFYLTKKLDMEFLPDEGEEIGEEIEDDTFLEISEFEDFALFFKVEKRVFYLDKYVHIILEPLFIINNKNKNDILKCMKKSGWTC